MSMPIVHTAGTAGQLQSHHSVIIYNVDSGKIVLVQNTVVFAGAKTPSPEERIRTALADAQKRGHEASKIAALDLGDKLLAPDKKYSVDPRTRSLQETAMEHTRVGLDRKRPR
jgi:hypothetical protein